MLRRLLVLPLLAGLLGLTALPAAARADIPDLRVLTPTQEVPPAEPVWAPLVRAEAAAAIVGIPERFQAAYSRWAVAAWWGRLAALVKADEARKAAEARAAEEARQRATRRSSSTATPSSSGHDPCAESIADLLPAPIIQRESRGQCSAYNHGGCGGRGCLGPAQIDEGHFYAVSPWNSNVPGTCYGLSYRGCVIRLKERGGLTPWACC